MTDALSALEAAFGAVVAGRGGVALVSGEAGIGKSSLVRAFVAAERRATRVLAGGCDDLAVPRPLCPFLDIAGELPGLAAELGTSGVDAARVVLDELRRDGATICIVEDAHWADEATIDVLTFVARRIEAAPALLVVSFRDDEVGPEHPLRRALAAAPAGCTYRIELERLSVEAIGRLAGPEVDATSLRAITGGNPFFVREALTSGPGRTPASVRDAVLARAARLSTRRTGGRRARERDPLSRPAGAGGGVRRLRDRSVPSSPSASGVACSSSTTTVSASVTSWRGGRSRSRSPVPGAGTSTGSCWTRWSAAARRRPAWRITPGGPATPTRSCGTVSTRLATRSRRARIAKRRRC